MIHTLLTVNIPLPLHKKTTVKHAARPLGKDAAYILKVHCKEFPKNRCPGWQQGRCSLPDGQAPCQHTCPECGMSVQASTDVYLNEVIEAHKSKPFMGKSQCENKIAGLI